MSKTNSFLNNPSRFPLTLPEGYRYLDEPVTFDPERHLALQAPEKIWYLQELGYTEDEIAQCPTDFAVSSAARVLSEEGINVLLDIARTLRQYAVGCERIENMVRGGVYQSRFLRDLCLCPEVTEFLSGIYGTEVAPHTMPMHLGHLNYAPEDLERAVDKWHHDTLGLDYVMMLSDPEQISGGEFQYFLGTKQEAAEFSRDDKTIPPDRVVSPDFPGAGYAIILHGYMVVHRATKLEAISERITMVNGYVPLHTGSPDPCLFSDLKIVDPHHVLFPEWARHKAWLARGKLDRLIDELPFTDDQDAIVAALKDAIQEVETAIDDLKDETEPTMIHYGG